MELDVLPRRFFVGQSPEINMFHVEHPPKSKCFTWNNTPNSLVSLPPRGDRQTDPAPHKHAITPNARLNHRREAAELVLRMFQLHEHRPREENAMFRSSCLNLKQPAKIAPFPGCKTARPPNPSEAIPSEKRKSRTAQNPAADFPRRRQTPPQSVDNPPASLYNKEKRHRRRQ